MDLNELLKPEVKEPVLADRSKVGQYAVCPYQASVGADEPNQLKDVGSEVHGLIEYALKSGIDDEMESHEIAEMVVDNLPTVRPDIQPQVIKAARYVADEISKMPIHKIIGVEYQIDYLSKMHTRDGRPFMLTMCLDILVAGNNSLIVPDWKSGFKKRTNEETFNDFQAQFAAYILWQMYPDINVIHWFFKETFWGSTSYARFDRNAEYPSLPHLSQELQIQGRIFEALKLWQDESTEAWPEPKKCTWCDCTAVCPHVVQRSADINKDPKAFLDELVATKAYYDKQLKTANDYVKTHGEIVGSETIMEWRQPKQKFTPKVYKYTAPDGEPRVSEPEPKGAISCNS